MKRNQCKRVVYLSSDEEENVVETKLPSIKKETTLSDKISEPHSTDEVESSNSKKK